MKLSSSAYTFPMASYLRRARSGSLYKQLTSGFLTLYLLISAWISKCLL